MTAMYTYRGTNRINHGISCFRIYLSDFDKTSWFYDPATGLLEQKLYADGHGPAYTYTADGKLATRTWARGITTTYEYDALGQLESVTYSDDTPSVTYTYDRLGRQKTVSQCYRASAVCSQRSATTPPPCPRQTETVVTGGNSPCPNIITRT
jgi:YD repeat-containing protein